MAKVLYITANPNAVEQSYSLTVGQAFVEAYQAQHPSDEVVHLDLYQVSVPHIDADVFSGWGKLQGGAAFENLASLEQSKVATLTELVNQFSEADKYVFVTPMWNFSYPPIVKNYIDAICVAGKTFKYTAQGPIGLLQGKKALHIQASGGVYGDSPINIGHNHIKTILNFVGVTDVQALLVEGHSMFPDKAAQIKQDAIEKATQLASTF